MAFISSDFARYVWYILVAFHEAIERPIPRLYDTMVIS
jgi:hypothetical protein